MVNRQLFGAVGQQWHASSHVPSRASPPKTKKPPLAHRIAELEARVRELEARLPLLAAPASALARAQEGKGRVCAGCQLELPKGARGTCVWCGFVLRARRDVRPLG